MSCPPDWDTWVGPWGAAPDAWACSAEPTPAADGVSLVLTGGVSAGAPLWAGGLEPEAGGLPLVGLGGLPASGGAPLVSDGIYGRAGRLRLAVAGYVGAAAAGVGLRLEGADAPGFVGGVPLAAAGGAG